MPKTLTVPASTIAMLDKLNKTTGPFLKEMDTVKKIVGKYHRQPGVQAVEDIQNSIPSGVKYVADLQRKLKPKRTPIISRVVSKIQAK